MKKNENISLAFACTWQKKLIKKMNEKNARRNYEKKGGFCVYLAPAGRRGKPYCFFVCKFVYIFSSNNFLEVVNIYSKSIKLAGMARPKLENVGGEKNFW